MIEIENMIGKEVYFVEVNDYSVRILTLRINRILLEEIKFTDIADKRLREIVSLNYAIYYLTADGCRFNKNECYTNLEDAKDYARKIVRNSIKDLEKEMINTIDSYK